jgi:hypothetical protein
LEGETALQDDKDVEQSLADQVREDMYIKGSEEIIDTDTKRMLIERYRRMEKALSLVILP